MRQAELILVVASLRAQARALCTEAHEDFRSSDAVPANRIARRATWEMWERAARMFETASTLEAAVPGFPV